MERNRNFGTLFLTALLLMLAACTPKSTPAAPPPVTEAPVLTEAVVEVPTEAPTEAPVEPTPTLEPIRLAGPPMQVGSKYQYIDGSILVAVPAGEFIMGHGGEDNPEHVVSLSDFWIYRAPVTNAQYAHCETAGQCSTPDLSDNPIYQDPLKVNNPVVGVTWEQAAAYCKYVHARLPTEAEWEKTGRGPDGNVYPWGNGAASCELANLADCTKGTTPVTDYLAGMSYYEALDMTGNSFEWVADWYKKSYYNESPLEDPLGPETGEKRSVRSSGFSSPFYAGELARRSANLPEEHRPDLGFRCVVEDPIYFAPVCEQVLIYGWDATANLDGTTLAQACPTLSVIFGEYCDQRYTPKTNVTVGVNPPGTLLDISIPGSCSGGPPVYNCLLPGGDVTVKADCFVPIPETVTCPPGFKQVGDTCIARGRPGRCLPGYNYDPADQCCTPLPGSDVSVPLCPLGSYYADPPGACVPYPASGYTQTGPLSIPFLSCGPPSDDGGCQLTAEICREQNGLGFDAKNCCCTTTRGECY